MPNDALTISYIAKELDKALSGGKITKINQPENDEVVVFVYSKFGTKKLVISANANVPRCHLTEKEKINPKTAPTFCMLLRKYLLGGVIERVFCPDADRNIMISVKAKNEMKDDVTLQLAVELISRQSNIILLDDNLRILGALKKNSLDDENAKRTIMTGAQYSFPTQDKIPFDDEEKIKDALLLSNANDISNFIRNKIGGYAATTISYITKNDEITDKKVIIERIQKLNNLEKYEKYSPCLGFCDGKIKDFFVTEYDNLPLIFKRFDTINEAIEAYYAEKDNVLRIKEHSKRLKDIIKHNIARTEKKLAAQKNQLSSSENLEFDRLCGELVTSNLYKIRQGERVFFAENYYENPPSIVEIKLDPSLSPSKNAQNYYKKYNKKKRTIENVSKQIIESEAHLQMLCQIRATLENITDVKQLELVENDLVACGVISQKKSKNKLKEIKAAPFEYEFDGFRIFVGRSSTENEYVTHKLGKSGDMWFHVKKAFGAHVLLKKINGREFPDEIFVVAAEIAAFYSEERASGKVEVDYTDVKNVKKPQNGKLGLVVYETNYSLVCAPNKHKELKK